MAFVTNVLVVANRTLDSSALLDALGQRSSRGPCAFTLLVPATAPGPEARAAARQRLGSAIAALADSGIDAKGTVGDSDPIAAFSEVWDPGRFDEIIVSTLPTHTSRWLLVDLPHRIERITGVPVTHVVAGDQAPAPPGQPAPEHHPEALGPLSVLGWGAPPRDPRG